jgi:murein DD-endopeptidase MepM/ murein hydrolase activator NlpD
MPEIGGDNGLLALDMLKTWTIAWNRRRLMAHAPLASHPQRLRIALAALLSCIGAAGSAASPRAPDGHHVLHAHDAGDHLSAEQDRAIVRQVEENIAKLRAQGVSLPADSPKVGGMGWPLGPLPGPGRDWHGISNFVDLDAAYPNRVRDYTCGDRSYDNANGYNHAGIDYFIWPFPWHAMDAGAVDVRAAAPGTLVAKVDGNDDRSCSFGAPDTPNFVVIRHGDGTIARYLHLKRGSVTSLAIGSAIAAGQVLGKVGSSGISTGPHLHFELRAGNVAGAAVIDPYQGQCNTVASAWSDQRDYREPRINRLSTHGEPPLTPVCPDPVDQPNFKNRFAPGDFIHFLAAYTDPGRGIPTQFRVKRPDGSEYAAWSFDMADDPNTPDFYNAAYWYWRYRLPVHAPSGEWTFEATMDGQTRSHTFEVGAPSLAIDDPRGLIGSWYEPATSGQGFEIQWIGGNTLLVYFYGHRDDGSNLFLLGVREGSFEYGQPLDIPLFTTFGGRFNNLDPDTIERADWGTLELTFESCERAMVVLAGEDGEQSLVLERLGRINGLTCE